MYEAKPPKRSLSAPRTFLSGVALAALVLAVSGSAEAGRRHSMLEQAADAVVDYIRNPAVDPSAPMVVGFTPGTGAEPTAEAVVIAAIGGAHRTVQAALYEFTNTKIARALVEAEQRGVQVNLVLDEKSNSGAKSLASYAATNGIGVRLDGRYSIAHHKYLVVDSRDVESGSFNWTQAAATRNAEDALLLRNVPDLAARYAREWTRLWNESEPFTSRY